MEKFRIGVIGVGSMGRNHVRILSTQKNCEFVGLYDADQNRARDVAGQFSVQAFPCVKALMEQTDAVTIAVPSSLHKEIALEAAQHGLHTLVEKPLALSSDDAREINNAFLHTDKILMVGHVERYNPVVTELCKLIQNEEIIALEVRRYSPYNGRITDADVVQDLMIHDIDLVCNVLLGGSGEIRSIDAVGKQITGKKLDFAQALMQTEQGVVASISASRITESKVREISIHTSHSFILADLLNRSLSVLRNTNLVIDGGKATSYRQESIAQKIFVPMVEPLHMELTDFIDCIVQEREPAASGAVACRAVEIAETIIGQATERHMAGGTK